MQGSQNPMVSASGKPRLSMISRICHEIARPLRLMHKLSARPNSGKLSPISLAKFDPREGGIKPEGLELLKSLVKESAQFDGPIIEIGTLIGITAVHIALAKHHHQRIITVDNYCWNPWGLSADTHHLLAHQVLLFLTESGQVEQVRMDKLDFYETYSGPPPSLVFLDAMHTYEETKKDIEWAIRAGASLIAGHDYSEKFPGVIRIVDELGGPRDLRGGVWALHPQPVVRTAD